MKKLIAIADWAADSLTNQEFRTAVEGFVQNPQGINMNFVTSTPSTIHTAFLIAQLVEIEQRYGRPLDTVIFQNTDPRIQTIQGVEKAQGAEFVIVRLACGVHICGPNAGFVYSMIKNQIEKIYRYPGLDQGSQFRSRDLYARVSAHLMDSMEHELDLEEIDHAIISELDSHYIAHIDNYGNLKTTLTAEQLKGKVELGESISIRINGVEKKVKYVSNLFGGTPGELVIYPGSSGHKDNPFLEITIWRHFTEKDITTGVHAFNHPRPGTEVILV